MHSEARSIWPVDGRLHGCILVQGLDSDKASMLYRPYVFVYRWVRCVRADEWKVFRLRPRLSAEQQGGTE